MYLSHKKFKYLMYCVGALNIDKPQYNITFEKAKDVKQRSAKKLY